MQADVRILRGPGRVSQHLYAAPVDHVVAEVAATSASGDRAKLIFFVDDNLACDAERLKEFLRALIPLRVSWVGQAGINVAHDPELLDLIVRSGCRCLLIGFESLQRPTSARWANRSTRCTAASNELSPSCGVFMSRFTGRSFRLRCRYCGRLQRTVQFTVDHGFLLAAFAHLMPFPGSSSPAPGRGGEAAAGTLVARSDYAYNTVAFQPRHLTPDQFSANVSPAAASSSPGPACSGAACSPGHSNATSGPSTCFIAPNSASVTAIRSAIRRATSRYSCRAEIRPAPTSVHRPSLTARVSFPAGRPIRCVPAGLPVKLLHEHCGDEAGQTAGSVRRSQTSLSEPKTCGSSACDSFSMAQSGSGRRGYTAA